MVRQTPTALSVTMAIVSFVIAAIPATGLVMKADPVGRIVFAVVWLLVGALWAGQLIRAK